MIIDYGARMEGDEPAILEHVRSLLAEFNPTNTDLASFLERGIRHPILKVEILNTNFNIWLDNDHIVCYHGWHSGDRNGFRILLADPECFKKLVGEIRGAFDRRGAAMEGLLES